MQSLSLSCFLCSSERKSSFLSISQYGSLLSKWSDHCWSFSFYLCPFSRAWRGNTLSYICNTFGKSFVRVVPGDRDTLCHLVSEESLPVWKEAMSLPSINSYWISSLPHHTPQEPSQSSPTGKVRTLSAGAASPVGTPSPVVQRASLCKTRACLPGHSSCELVDVSVCINNQTLSSLFQQR